MTAILLDGVSAHYGAVKSLDDVSFAVEQGGRVGLVGESGSGKSTLCRLLVGLRLPSGGELSVFDRPVADHLRTDARQFRRNVQLIMQDAVASLSPRMRIRSLLQEVITIHSLPADETWRWIETLTARLGLPNSVFERYPHEISGGQARRLAIVRALALKPRIVVADEPTAGLDVSVQGGLLNLLIEIQRELSLTYLMISHDLRVIRRVTGRMLVMYLGQIVEDGETEALFRKPAHPYSAALLSTNAAHAPGKAGQPIILHGEIPSAINPPPGCRFHTRCPVAQTRCKTDPPSLRRLPDNRSVRCHFPYSLSFA
ncbi:oligopeptide/dipeptide ABC transporter ATP-binding protein [Mesorhizobium sp. B2-3-4]|uniref:oligopeptide/dipeptide ABC transporter ATP-binding protein n=1 Tax=Mesorhizobium sp. B2-3-4 TaxID=2589959 RepID=UPI00112A5D67|nr:oligopeptide/dipeptide ABC transporter ATP-binding protein [Mesorhizobium sp. B2-3-4]TPM38545.1 ATP-binding cassette domain-containing protein [Mesorhizobium sp. B2-3-4]